MRCASRAHLSHSLSVRALSSSSLPLRRLLNAILGGQPVYSQTKFSQINFSISHDLDATLPSHVCAMLCGIFFIAPLQIFNVLPRFLLSGLLCEPRA